MKPDDILYGLESWELLQFDPDEVVERVLEEACEEVGEGFDALAARITWPIRILVYKRRDIGGEKRAGRLARNALDYALDYLDDAYLGDDASPTEATEDMKAAALAFGRAVVKDYVSWTCEPTGQVIEYTREQAEREEPCVDPNIGVTKNDRDEDGA